MRISKCPFPHYDKQSRREKGLGLVIGAMVARVPSIEWNYTYQVVVSVTLFYALAS